MTAEEFLKNFEMIKIDERHWVSQFMETMEEADDILLKTAIQAHPRLRKEIPEFAVAAFMQESPYNDFDSLFARLGSIVGREMLVKMILLENTINGFAYQLEDYLAQYIPSDVYLNTIMDETIGVDARVRAIECFSRCKRGKQYIQSLVTYISKHSEEKFRVKALSYASRLSDVLPFLNDPSPSVLDAAISRLQRFAGQAKPLIPRLVEITKEKESLGDRCLEVIRKISPDCGAVKELRKKFGIRRSRSKKAQPKRTSPSRADLVAAFKKAQMELGTKWKLHGRGHCVRVTLKSSVSDPASQGADKSFDELKMNFSYSRTKVFPRVLVEKAAAILGVSADSIISREV